MNKHHQNRRNTDTDALLKAFAGWNNTLISMAESLVFLHGQRYKQACAKSTAQACSYPSVDQNFFNRQTQMKLSELLALTLSSKAHAEKAHAEITARFDTQQAAINALTAKLADIDIPEDVAAAVVDVNNATAALDDIIPEAMSANETTEAITEQPTETVGELV
jgi:ubiquinone biosynthesis protein COQ9